MRKLMLALSACTLFAACQKSSDLRTATPTSSKQTNSSSNARVLGASLSFCYSPSKTTPDSWKYGINMSGGSPGVSTGIFEVSYDFVSPLTGTSHVSLQYIGPWPTGGTYYMSGSGNGGYITNIVLRQTTTEFDINGTPVTVYTNYSVNPC